MRAWCCGKLIGIRCTFKHICILYVIDGKCVRKLHAAVQFIGCCGSSLLQQQHHRHVMGDSADPEQIIDAHALVSTFQFARYTYTNIDCCGCVYTTTLAVCAVTGRQAMRLIYTRNQLKVLVPARTHGNQLRALFHGGSDNGDSGERYGKNHTEKP